MLLARQAKQQAVSETPNPVTLERNRLYPPNRN